VSNEKRVERGGQTVKYIFLNTSGRIVPLVLGSMTFTSAAKVLIMTAFFQFIRKDSVKRWVMFFCFNLKLELYCGPGLKSIQG